MGDENLSHGMRHYNLCRAVDGIKLSIALDAIKAVGADPEMVRMGQVLIDEGRKLIILANDRVGDGNRICACTKKIDGEYKSCGLRYNHAGECALREEGD